MRMRVMRVTTMMMLNEDADDDDDDDDLLLGLSFSGQLHRAHRLKDRIISKFNYLYSHHIYCNHSDVHLTPCHRYNYLGLPIT